MRRLTLLLPLLVAGCLMYDEYDVIPARHPVSATRVVDMKRNGIDDEAILALIAAQGKNREQNADDLVMMKNAGAGDAVIKAMVQAPVVAPREEQVVSRRTTYYHHPGDDLAYFGLGLLFGRWWGHGGWHYRGCR